MTRNKKEIRNLIGKCKLTNETGVFIESHLLPKALTKPDQKGAPFRQLGSGKRSIRRWSSWFDPELVIQSGENILTEYDTWAISELRKHKLIWSSWGSAKNLGEHHTTLFDSIGIRQIEFADTVKMRLFFLSLLWRAAATNRTEFSEIQMPEEDLEQLRIMLCTKNPEPLSFYPTTLTQLSTKGIIHNQSPIAQIKEIPSLVDNVPPINMPIFRFYFDGLIAHIHRHASDNGYTSSLDNMIIGAEKTLVISTQNYENSFQKENLNFVIAESLD